MSAYPTALERTGDGGLHITWSDGYDGQIPLMTLRKACPCATCREKRREKQDKPNLLPILKPEEAQPLSIAAMKPVGSYAYSVAFSDGHDTGIYTFEWLRELCEANDTK